MTFLLFFLRRIIQLIPALIGITIVAFLLLRVLPGDPASLLIGARGSEADVIALRRQLGLDAPLWQQYLTFLGDVLNGSFGLDPILAGVLFTPVFYGLGVLVYRVYYESFERRGDEALRGLVFFFGILFIIEVSLSLKYGVDYRLVQADYIGRSIEFGGVGIAYRLLVPCLVGLAMTVALYLFLGRTFYGRAIMAVSQDAGALRLMGADPIRIKTIAFGIGIAAAGLAGALAITIAPVVPSSDRDYIGRMFAITVLGGMGSIGGTLVAAIILGVVESLMGTFFGPSWSPAVSFGILLIALAVRPAGLFGR
jgi:branched-chain amino acid transport system permease protein